MPPKTAIARNFGSLLGGRLPLALVRGLSLVQRQAEALPDLLLDDLGRGPRVHDEDVLLAPENLEDGLGLPVILPEPDRQRFFGVIFPGDQLPPHVSHCPGTAGLLAIRL